MTSSGYKRGLATAAISAMAVTGLPFFAGAAYADSLNTQVGANNVDLVTFDGNTATNTISTKNDGQNTTFRLEAVGGSNVAQVKFQYSIGASATKTDIATVSRNDDGAFSTEWTPAGLAGANLTIYAVGLAADGTTVVDTDSDTATVDNGAETVNITDAGTAGVFQAPYTGNSGNFVGVSGTASSNAPVNLEYYTSGGFVNGGNATPSGTNHAWAAVLDITAGYNYGTNDQLLVSADNGASDDTEAFSLYKQSITTVTATADRTTVPAGTPANITITVADQNGKPIAGAEVRDASTALVGYTDGKGQVTTTQNGGAANNTYYYANATDSDPYEPELGDKKSDTVAIAQYNAAPTSLAGNSRDGAAFDKDEYDADDITVQVKDQQNTNYDTTGQTLTYRWMFTPAAGGAAQNVTNPGGTPATATQPVENNGKFVVPAPANGFAADGTYELYASLNQDAGGNGAIAESKLLTLSSGDAEITFKQTQPQQAAIGDEVTVNGSLTLWSGGPGLAARPIRVSRTDGGAGNAQFNQDTGADAATYDTKTDANGNFSATLDDPATPTTGEDDEVTATTTDWTHDGDTDNANETASQDVSFVQSVTPARVTINDNGIEQRNFDGEAQAGEIRDYSVLVEADSDPNTAGVQGQPLTNKQVTLTVDHGYFTDGVPQGSVGDDAGVYDNDGQTITVTTDGTGVASFKVSMGRDQGFDDDGMVDSTVTATAGTVSDTEKDTWTSENPLNPGEVTVDFAGEDEQDSTILPKARFNDQNVALVVKAFDQFGNRVGNTWVNLTDNTNHASVGNVWTDYDEEADTTASADQAVDQDITASWTNDTEVLAADGADAGTAPDVVDGPDATVTDDITIEWYGIDWAASSYTLESDTGDTASVNEPVTMTVTVLDQEGQPIQGLWVDFIRTGPYQSGDVNASDMTDVNGEATYNWKSDVPDTVRISATVDNFGGTQVAKLETVVNVEGETVPPHDIVAKLLGANNGKANDKLTVKVEDADAAGATVKLWKLKKNGKRVLVGEDVLTATPSGAVTTVKFVVNDPNGKKKTRYQAKVLKTDKTNADLTNVKKIR